MALLPDIHIHVHHTHDPAVLDGITRLETTMATAAEDLAGLKADLTDFFADMDAKLDQLVEAQGTLNPEAKALFDEIKATVAAKDAEMGDADGSDPEPVEPTA